MKQLETVTLWGKFDTVVEGDAWQLELYSLVDQGLYEDGSIPLLAINTFPQQEGGFIAMLAVVSATPEQSPEDYLDFKVRGDSIGIYVEEGVTRAELLEAVGLRLEEPVLH